MTSALEWNFESASACPICGCTESGAVLERTVRSVPLRFVRCKACELVYQNPRPTRNTLDRYFSSSTFIKDSDDPDFAVDEYLGYADYMDWDVSYKRTAALRLRRIARFAQPPGRLLEIGSATGSFLAAARDSGYVVRGLDVSSTFAAMARKTHSLEIDVGFVEEYPLPENSFDVVCNFGGITCWRDPLKGLENIAHALKPGGVLAINHPNLDSPVVRALGKRYFEFNHASLTIMSNKTMNECLNRAGFRVLFSENERQFASLGRIATYLQSKIGVRLTRMMHLDQLIIPVVVFGTTFSISAKR